MKITKSQFVAAGYIAVLILFSYINITYGRIPIVINVLGILCTQALGFFFLEKKRLVFFISTITGAFISASVFWYCITVFDPSDKYYPFLSAVVFSSYPVLFGIFVSLISIVYSKVKSAVKE